MASEPSVAQQQCMNETGFEIQLEGVGNLISLCTTDIHVIALLSSGIQKSQFRKLYCSSINIKP